MTLTHHICGTLDWEQSGWISAYGRLAKSNIQPGGLQYGRHRVWPLVWTSPLLTRENAWVYWVRAVPSVILRCPTITSVQLRIPHDSYYTHEFIRYAPRLLHRE